MADARLVARGYAMPTVALCNHFYMLLNHDADPLRRVKQTLDIARVDTLDILAALAFSCDPDKKPDADTPAALQTFVPTLRQARLTEEQIEKLQHALIDSLPVHLQDEIRAFFPGDEQVGTPVGAREKMAQWLETNATPARIIEPLLGLPDAAQRVLDALDHAWLDTSHESVGEFQCSLQTARSELAETEPGDDALYNASLSAFTLFSMGHAVRSQLASLAGIRPQFDRLVRSGLAEECIRKAAADLIDLHRVASSVMQPLDGLGSDVRIGAVKQAMTRGNATPGNPSICEAYDNAKMRYLGKYPGQEADAAARFERTFLYRMAAMLPRGYQTGAIEMLNGTMPLEEIKDRIFERSDQALAFMHRIYG